MWAGIVAAIAAIVGAVVQSSSNKNLASFQAQKNQELLDQQLGYDRPSAQMARFQEAGLNPALIYGQGSAGNQGSPLSFPEIKQTDYQGAAAGVAQSSIAALQAKLLQSQRQALDSKTIESQARSGLIQVQTAVAKQNPYLNEAASQAMVESWISAAEIKAAEAGIATQRSQFMLEKSSRVGHEYGDYFMQENGMRKMQYELDTIEQRFHLGKADQKIKAAVLDSKEFQNAILEVQTKFMKDGDLTPQHFVTFLQLLLMKFAK